MTTIYVLAEIFLISVAFGLSIFSPVASSKLTGNGFLKLLSSLSFGSLLLAFILNFLRMSWNAFPHLFYLLVLVSIVAVYFFHKDDKSPFMWLLYIIQSLSFLLIFYFLGPGDLKTYFFVLSSSLFLGIVTYSMILGHWYLVVPKLSEYPLKVALVIMWVIIFMKVLLTGAYLIENFKFFSEGSQLGAGFSFNWLMLTMRVGWGYLIIVIMSYFGWRLVKMRSIQSATGIFYAMTFFVFIGELISNYLHLEYGMLI